jgi:hypothetical protein
MADWFSARGIYGHAVRMEQIFAWTAGPAAGKTCRQEIPDTG